MFTEVGRQAHPYTHHKPSAGMPDAEGPAHRLAGRGDGYPLNTDLDWGRSSILL